MIFYFVGVVLMAIAIVYFNYQMLPKYIKDWAFWVASTLLCLLSWLSIVMVVVLTIKKVLNNCNNESNRGKRSGD